MKMQKLFLTLVLFLSIISSATAQAVSAGTYTITNKNSNLCLAIRGATQRHGEEGTQWTCDGNADKNWKLIDAGSGYFKIQNQNSNHFLAVGGSSRDRGGRCLQSIDTGQPDIIWRFIDAGAGWYKIQNRNSGLFLAIGGGARTGGADLIQWGDEGQEDVKWKLNGAGASGRAVMTRFNPSVHGFKFANNFTVQTRIAGFNGPSFGGLCGGMVYSALDYFYANRTIPQQNYIPAEGMPLQSYIWQRQQNSAIPNADKWAEYGLNPFGARNREFFTWGIQFGSGRLGELMSKIDRGDPVPLGLQLCGGDCGCPGGCPGSHQVLAIGYQLGRYNGDQTNNIEDVSIFVYDPNYPNRTLTLKPQVAGAMYLYSEEGGNRWRAYFTDMKYSKSTPPNILNTPNEVVATFRTGGDDLRGGKDNVNLVLLLRSGATVRFDNVNNGQRWADGSIQPVSRPLAANIRAEDIVGVRIETTFSGGFGGDNWNMEELNVVARVNGVSRTIVNQRGTPLVRFTGDVRSREFRQ